MWGSLQMMHEGRTDKQIAAKYDKAIKLRIRELFPRSAAYADVHREKGLSSHFCRKIYIGYGWKTLTNTNEVSPQSFAVDNLGWQTLGAYNTSNSYLDLQIIMLPPTVPPMSETRAALDEWVKYCVKQKEVILEKNEDDDDDENMAIIPRAKRLRGLKRTHINLKHATTGEHIRVPFHIRKKHTKESLVLGAKNIVQSLRDAGEVPTSTMLRAFGIGSELSKAALST
jgi:hypothetical protein